MKKLFALLFMVFALPAFADPMDSVLNEKANLPGFGEIAYRGPLANNHGDVVVLFQAIFGGTTHRHMREVRDLLDASGARVYTLDLVGTGESNSPKLILTMELVDQFVSSFLTNVVKEPSIVVAEQLLGMSALEVSKSKPELFKRLVIVSPVGVIYLMNPPNERQNTFFQKYWNDDAASLSFYNDLVSEKSARYYLGKAYHDPAQVNDLRVREITFTAQFPEQRWATVCFVGGKLYRSYESATNGVKIPVLAIFGQYPTSPMTGGKAETMDLFQAVHPDFQYKMIENAGNLPHRERPEAVVKAILEFAKQ